MTRITTGQNLIHIEGGLSHCVYNIMDDHIKNLHDNGNLEKPMHEYAPMTHVAISNSLPAHSYVHALQPHPFSALPPRQQNSHISLSQPQAPLAQQFDSNRFQHPSQPPSFGPMSVSSQQHPQTHHSVLASMDLMLPSSFSAQPSRGNNPSSFGKGSLFQSSSHHTSHTAAAGDLLSMSHRPMETSSNNAKEQTKKRTASYSGRSHMEAMMMNSNISPFVMPQQQLNVFSWNAATAVAGSQQLPTPNSTANSVSANGSMLSSSSTSASASGSWFSQLQEQQDRDSDESYQHHRTIRQCRRSDSYEMMDDGL
ncbi:hypothetical protein ACHAW6_008331 [Cyclotella cf. meneghiniana]